MVDIKSLDFKNLTPSERTHYVNKLPSEHEWAQGLILGDEWANILTHLLGLVLSVLAGGYQVFKALEEGSHDKALAFTIYSFGMVTLFGASTLYHAARRHQTKKILRTIDHCAIYFCIAGTYTPFTNMVLDKPWGEWLFSLVWGSALLGTVFKLFYTHRFKGLSICIYFAMGSLIVIAAEPLFESFPYEGILWIVFGGVWYALGIVFYLLDRRRFFHAIWHLFVIGGSACHYIATCFI